MVYKYEKLGEELIKLLKQRKRSEASSGCRENMRTVSA